MNTSRKICGLKEQKTVNKDNIYWIPALNIDMVDHAEIEYKIESRTEPFYIQLQGVSTTGLLEDCLLILDPPSTKSRRRKE